MKSSGKGIQNEIIKTVERLVSFRTTPSNFTEFEKAVEFIEKYFKEGPIIIEKHHFNKFPALYISRTGSKQASILLQAHVDVVNGNDSQFTPVIKNNKMYGRGTSDMKGFVAIAMKLLSEFSELNNKSNVALLLTFDEEIGSENGAKKMMELGYTGDIIINGDAGYNYSVVYGEKGILKIKIKVEASPGRHPYVWEGKNAFELLNEDYKEIIKLFSEKEIATEDDNWYTTYSIYDIEVKNREMYPPHYAEAKINFYFTENLSVNEFLSLLRSKIRHCDIEMILGSERVFVNPQNEYIKQMHKIMSKHFTEEISVRTENGSSDARFYADKNIPIIILRPVGEDHHGDNEFLDLMQIMPMYNSLREFIAAYINQTNKKKLKENVDVN